jgi:hypothetical protein
MTLGIPFLRTAVWLASTLALSPVCRAEQSQPAPVQVNFRVFSATNPAIGVPSYIYRRKVGQEGQLLANTNAEGRLEYREAECDLVFYSAAAQQPNVYPRRLEWRQCGILASLEFALAPSGLSSTALALLNGQIPAGFALPKDYSVVIAELKAAQDQGQWGAVAKLSSHLAAQFHDAGYSAEANAFSEISLATAASVAAQETEIIAPAGPLIATNKFGTPILTFEAVKAVEAFQQNCGVQPTGQVGWTTMGCLAGGAGYTLPKETALFPPSDAFKPELDIRG